jgi:cyclophilin family peptidyl-prolyl cis-trans isomerase|tara:strand:- start:235 stop:861 length:627 start_codon:yes stop_codon:yes gene_type:complete
MKKISLFIFLVFIYCGTNETDLEINSTPMEEEIMAYDKTYKNPPEFSIDVNKTYTAEINTTSGLMIVELFTDIAPNTVNNFVVLSEDGYYNNIIFHRVIKDFMIQGGDPSGTGHGEMGKYPGYEFGDELNNPMPYEKGILAMANRGPNTNGSQFFIMHTDYPLPYQYTIFGKVTEGLDVIDQIAMIETDSSDKPLNDVIINSITIKNN